MDTAGMAYNIKWLFGRGGDFSSPHDFNFHLLTSAPTNVLLIDTFLSGTKSFSEYDSYLMDRHDDYEDEDMRNFLLAIDFDKKKNRTPGIILTVLRYRVFPLTIVSSECDFIFSLGSPVPKLVRRGEGADRIFTLPTLEGLIARALKASDVPHEIGRSQMCRQEIDCRASKHFIPRPFADAMDCVFVYRASNV
jgi:hypothetical protein